VALRFCLQLRAAWLSLSLFCRADAPHCGFPCSVASVGPSCSLLQYVLRYKVISDRWFSTRTRFRPIILNCIGSFPDFAYKSCSWRFFEAVLYCAVALGTDRPGLRQYGLPLRVCCVRGGTWRSRGSPVCVYTVPCSSFLQVFIFSKHPNDQIMTYLLITFEVL